MSCEAISTQGQDNLAVRWKRLCRFLIGWLLEKTHAPAKIREFEHVDSTSGLTVYLSTGKQYSVLHVGGDKFFFDRITGKFDGTGKILGRQDEES